MSRRKTHPKTHLTSQRRSGKLRGFTLVELMVVMIGALFVIVATFMLVRDFTHFFQREGDLSLSMRSASIGFERLRDDIARAGFMSSPNLARDINRCPRSPSGSSVQPPQQVSSQLNAYPGIQDMALLHIVADSAKATPSLDSNKQMTLNDLDPDTITLWGNYTTAESFSVNEIDVTGSLITLEPTSSAIVQSGATTTDMLANIFPEGSIIRVLDETNREQYGVVEKAEWNSGVATITLNSAVGLIEKTSSERCGIRSETGANRRVNPVNIVRYELANLSSDASFAPIYRGDGPDYDSDRLDLVRHTLDTSLGVSTSEVVAEYASDLKFGLTVVSDTLTGALTYLGEDHADLSKYAGVPHESPANATGAYGAHLIRGVHARLVIRNRQADRSAPILDSPAPDALYRIQVADGQYARIRTLRSHIATRNTGNSLWQ